MTPRYHHAIKVNRAVRLASIGRYPASAAAMLSAIPDCLIVGLTARQIAVTMDANWDLAQASKALAAREIIENGFVWDARHGISRDLATKTPKGATIRLIGDHVPPTASIQE